MTPSNYIKRVTRYILLSMLLVAVWITYEPTWLALFDKYVLTPFTLFKTNIWNRIFVYAIAAYSVYVLFVQNIKNQYQYNPAFVYVTAWSTTILSYYRCGNLYIYEPLIGSITYIDVLIGLGVIYVVSACINFVRGHVARIKDKKLKVDSILYDNPIADIEEDVLDWSDEVDKLLGVIKQLQQSQPISIAVNAQWGAGKTSFLRLLQSSISTNEYEVIYFNPQESMSASEIQEDFFQQLISSLAKYNGTAEHNIKKYMQALQIIDDKSWLTKMLNIYDVWNKESHRDKIKRICDKLPVKVIIIIDDFDRLAPDEIHQVLKLINSNASFSNFIFLTAYDKNIVNKVLEKIGKTEDAYFTDKYFDLEYALPIRSYDYILEYFTSSLCTSLHLDENGTKKVSQSFRINMALFRTALPTIRDAKRFVNQVLLDYHLVEGEVVLSEFLYVQLLKYKYPTEYVKLSQKQYLDEGFATLCLSQEISASTDIKCLPILRVLFQENEEDYKGDSYRHIYSKESFDVYFCNKLYNSLRVGEMRKIFEVDKEQTFKLIDGWINEKHAGDVSNYLNSFYIDMFTSRKQMLRYAGAAAFLAIKTSNASGHTAFSRVIYMPILEECLKKCQISIAEYKKYIMDILTDRKIDPYWEYIYDLNQYYCHGIFDEEGSIIKRLDIWPIIKEDYINQVNNDKLSEIYAQDLIAKCVDHLDADKKSILNQDCCKAYRSYLNRHPEGFMAAFVVPVLDTMGNMNLVGCNHYYLQIFGTQESFIAFANSCKEKGVAYSDQVLNFMKLYAANDYEPLNFRGHEDLKELLRTYDFSHEVELLGHLQSINRILDERLEDKQLEGDAFRVELTKMHEEIKNIDLNVKLRDRLYKSLNDVLSVT